MDVTDTQNPSYGDEIRVEWENKGEAVFVG